VSYRLGRIAEADIRAIGDHIARDNPPAAVRMVRRLADQFVRLARNPFLGAARPELAPDARHAVVRPYLILYCTIPDGIEIVRVVHGARALTGLLKEGAGHPIDGEPPGERLGEGRMPPGEPFRKLTPTPLAARVPAGYRPSACSRHSPPAIGLRPA